MKNLFTLLFVFFLHSAWATNYYFSAASGDDSRTAAQAQNPSTPWKTIDKLNAYFSSLQPGDSVLFKRGETFYGTIIVNKSGTASSPIAISAYGTGSRPVITGLTTLTNWVSVGNGIYESYSASLGTNLNMLVLNDAQQPIGRYPNTGYLTLESHSGKTSITDNELSSTPNWTDAQLVIRTCHWMIERFPITGHSGNTLYYSGSYDPRDNYGYFIQNSIKTLDKLGEWYYNPSTKEVSMFFGSNSPSSYTVKAAAISNLIYSSGKSYIVFDNLTLKGANENGININSGSNIIVKNSDILFSGINGVSALYHTNFKLESCTVSSSNNDGVITDGSKTVIIRNNVIKNTYSIAGMGKGGNGKGAGVRVSNSGLVEYNQIINSGYVGIDMSGDNTVVKNNYIDTFCYIKDDGAGIYMSNSKNVTNTGRKITGNIILNGIGAGAGAGTTASSAEGIYIDDNVNGVEMAGNTVSNCNRGIYLHNSRQIVIKNNTSFNNNNGQLHMKYDAMGQPIRNNTITNNIFFSKLSKQIVSSVNTQLNDIESMGRFDSNFYARPIDDRTLISNTTSLSESSFDLEGWKLKYGKDASSKTSTKKITPYKITSLIGVNKSVYGSFSSSTDIKKTYANNCTVTVENSGVLDGGYLKIVPSSGNSIVLYGLSLVAGKKYIVKYSVKSTGRMSMAAFLRGSSTLNYASLTEKQYTTITTTRSENEMIFSPSQNDINGVLVFMVDAKYTYYIDNVQVYEAGATVTNPDDSIRFVINPSQISKTVNLDGNYVDAKNNKFSNSIVLQPYGSAVLIKNGGVQNTVPTVSLTSPVANATIAAPASVTISATATDADGTISKVEFYNGNTLLGTATSSPYNFTWNNVSAGNYTITAKATNNSSLVTTSSAVAISVYTPNVAPSVSLTSPVANATIAAPASITISADAADTDGSISKVDFYNNDTLIGTATARPYTFTWNNIPTGNYTIIAKATDDSSIMTVSAPVAISVYTPNVAPSVRITSPVANATVAAAASITISADATDTDGSINKVDFYNDDTLIGTATASPYTFTWTNLSAGSYTITAKATDDSLAVTTSATVDISVYTPNVAPSVSLTSPVATTKYIGAATITMTAAASDTDGSISKVEFYNGTTLLKTVFAAPYTFSWSNVGAGTYIITAKATDNNSLSGTSTAFTLVIVPNIAPVVRITSPVINTTYSGPATINMSAIAIDADGSISKVVFYNGATLLCTEKIAPYTYSWQNVPAGSYTIIAKATDNKGTVTNSDPVTVVVAAPGIAIAPVVRITSPVINATYNGPATINMSALASDADGSISKVEFYNGTTLLCIEKYAPYTYSWKNVSAGNYTIIAKATDNKGTVTASAAVAISVYAPNVAPSVSLTSPVATTKYTGTATINMSAKASDVDGSISKVEFYNGATLLCTEKIVPYTYSWKNVPAGNYTITAKAIDNKGTVTTSASVTVSVAAPTVGLKSSENNDTTSVINNIHALNLKPDYISKAEAGTYNVKVFPNPAVNKIQISIDGLQMSNPKANLIIQNISGITIKSIPVTLAGRTIETDVTSLASGMYIVSIVSDNFKISKKFIKN